MLRAVGMGDDDWVKPQIGVGSSWNEITPCNMSLQRLAKDVKNGVHEAGGTRWSSAPSRCPTASRWATKACTPRWSSREVIADSVETVVQAERLDGTVLLAGCDKSIPGMLMAAARLDLASAFFYNGSIMPGIAKLTDGTEKEVTIIDAFEAVGACVRGLMSREDVDIIERAICPGEGACGGMYTANTMAVGGRGAGHVAAGQRVAGGRGQAARRIRPQVRRGGRRDAAPRHHRARHPHQGSLRERHRRRDGVRRVHQRGAAPAGDRPRGRGRADAGRLHPHRAPRCPHLADVKPSAAT